MLGNPTNRYQLVTFLCEQAFGVHLDNVSPMIVCSEFKGTTHLKRYTKLEISRGINLRGTGFFAFPERMFITKMEISWGQHPFLDSP